MKKAIITVFTLILFTLCLSFDSQAVMPDSEVKSRLSDYSSSYVKTADGVIYLEYEKAFSNVKYSSNSFSA